MRLGAEREKLGHALAEIARIEQAIAALAAERVAAVEFVKNESGSTTELRMLAAYLLAYDARVADFQKSLEVARLRAGEQRQRVIAADRDERLLLKLKDKQRAAWQEAADHELEVLAQESWNAVHFDRHS